MEKIIMIKSRLFNGLERAVKQYLVSNTENMPVEVQYNGPDYEGIFFSFLEKKVTKVQLKLIIDELNSGAEIFGQEVLAIFLQNNPSQFPKALKKIAKNADTYPQVSSLIMDFYLENNIGSVDAVDDFGETAFSKTLKADKTRKTPLLFLANYGAKHCSLSQAKQDTLSSDFPEIYQSAQNNTAQWQSETVPRYR
ncbi:MAG: hypothetical protein H0U57_13860 [Tatlockia sp.]|nr:hypothetical protein [Tatlockia sp.]